MLYAFSNLPVKLIKESNTAVGLHNLKVQLQNKVFNIYAQCICIWKLS